MCLAVPMKIVAINDSRATVEAGNVKRQVGLQMTPDAGVGDYVLIHAGFAIEVLSEEYALETLKLFEEMERLA